MAAEVVAAVADEVLKIPVKDRGRAGATAVAVDGATSLAVVVVLPVADRRRPPRRRKKGERGRPGRELLSFLLLEEEEDRSVRLEWPVSGASIGLSWWRASLETAPVVVVSTAVTVISGNECTDSLPPNGDDGKDVDRRCPAVRTGDECPPPSR